MEYALLKKEFKVEICHAYWIDAEKVKTEQNKVRILVMQKEYPKCVGYSYVFEFGILLSIYFNNDIDDIYCTDHL